MKSNERGYALLIVLALLVLVTSVVAGSFSAISRSQRETGREFTRLRTDWAARALYESAVYKFQKFVVNQGHPPNPGAEINQLIQSAKDLIKDDYPNVKFDLQIQHQETSNAKDVYYSIGAKATDDLTGVSSSTGLKAEEKGYVYTTTGSVLDYGVFNDGDLEISPGEDLEIQGPIFSNGNIYLMSGIGKSLTLSEPDSSPSSPVQFTSDYILHTSGNIFFYFKPVVARNYMLEQSDTYKNGAVSFYKDDDEYHGAEASWSVLKELTINGEKKLVGYPRLYYFKNQILDTDWIVKPAEHNIYFKKRGDSGKGERMNFPQFSYWWGDTWEYFVGNASYTNHYYDVNAYPASENMSISPGFDLDNRIFYNNLTFDSVHNRYGFPEGEDSVTASSAVNPKWPAYRDRLNSDLNAGSSELPLNEQMSRQVVNLAEDANGNNHALIEPVYATDSSALKNQKLVSKADIVIQCANSDCTQMQVKYRTLEGYKNGTGDNLNPFRSAYALSAGDPAKPLFYMRPMRNLRLARVTTADSRGVPYYTDANHNPVNRYENAYYQSLVINMTGLNDALEECKKWNDGDDATSSAVIAQDDALCQINVKDGLIIYAETKSFRVLKPGTGSEGGAGKSASVLKEEGALSDDSGGDLLTPPAGTSSWPVRQLILENGERLIRNGVSVATNGWMWTRGNFNVWEYPSETQEVGSATRCVFPEVDSAAWKNCKTPAAALFSDAYGIIASNGTELDAFESSSGMPTVSRAPRDQNVMVNATVLTGYLASTLERSFPDCQGLSSPDQLQNCGGWGWPGTDYIGAPCPAGLDSNGNPIEKKNCNFYLKKQNGVFYFRRNAILRDWLTILKHEVSEYQAIREHFKYTLSDGTVLDALRFPDQPNWFSGTANSLTIPQLLTELQSDIAAMEDHMTQYVDFDPNDSASYQILETLKTKYGRTEFHLPTFEGYFVDPPNVGAVRGALYGPLGYNSEGVKKDPKVGDVYAYRYAADKTTAAYTFLGHPVYPPGVEGGAGDLGGFYSTPNFGSAWIVFEPKLADILNEDTQKQQRYRNQVKLMWCGSANPPADFVTILATCTDAEKTNQIYWRMFSYDFNQFPYHWTGIPFYAGTSYWLGLGQKAGDASAKAVTGFPTGPVIYSPDATLSPYSKLQPIGVPQINGIGYQSVRIESFYQANMIGTSSGSGKWVVHPGVNETDPPTQEYIPDPNATARFLNVRDTRRSWGAAGFLKPDDYNVPWSTNPNSGLQGLPWNSISYVHGRQYPMYDVRYSGGWENLMNFQEQWAWNTSCSNDKDLGLVCQRYLNQLYFRGSQAAPWKSQEMLRIMSESGRRYDVADSSKPAGDRRPPRAFWRTDYYSAPQRYYDYDERLSYGLMHRPPGMINLVSVSRAKRLPKTS